jgi:hypothetical protein
LQSSSKDSGCCEEQAFFAGGGGGWVAEVWSARRDCFVGSVKRES